MSSTELSRTQVEFVRNYVWDGLSSKLGDADPRMSIQPPVPPDPPPFRQMQADAARDTGARVETDRLRAQATHARKIWIGAKDAVDADISGLQRVLREIDDANCQLIADKGLSGFTAGFQSDLIAALMSAEKCSAERVADMRSHALKAVETYHAFVESSDKIAAIETVAALPEIGSPVRIRAAFSGALRDMKSVLQR